jgi:hypothetical protein
VTKKPPRLNLLAKVDLPVLEASGVAVRRVDGDVRVLAVGDRTWHIVAGEFDGDYGINEWRTLDLSGLADWQLGAGDSQLEAVAVDGGSFIALMREDPPVVLLADTTNGELLSKITLVAPPGSELSERWDDPSSRGEGLILLRGGRLLVAKEKRPRALIEFAPIGSRSLGLAQHDFLGPNERWDAPEGDVDFVATAMWKLRDDAKTALGDISALAVGSGRGLWFLSDKSRCVARLSLDRPLSPGGGAIRTFDEVWRLPKGTEKPEGISALASNRVLVAMDTDLTQANGMIVGRPES